MKKILLIEDNRELADNFALLLRDKGFEVICSYSGTNGLEILLENKPDLILCDIMLPDISGYKLLSELKKLNNIDLPIFIFITAKTQRQDFRKGMELGADDYITKPFTFEELVRSINVQLSKRKNFSTEKNTDYESQTGRSGKKETVLNYNDYIFFDDKKNPGFYPVHTIILIKSMKDYTRVSLLGDKKFILRKPMKYWENRLPLDKFIRVHKQTIVNLDFIERVEAISSNRYNLKIRSLVEEVEVSQRFSKTIREIFG